MKLHVTALIAVSACVMVLCACSVNKQPQAVVYETPLGSQTDEHGCKPAAGYMWSKIKGDCIRIWEEGIQLNNVIDKNAAYAAFLVLSEDSTKVEAFMVETSGANPILYREGATADSWCSNSKFSGAYRAVLQDSVWTLWKGQEKIYDNAVR